MKQYVDAQQEVERLTLQSQQKWGATEARRKLPKAKEHLAQAQWNIQEFEQAQTKIKADAFAKGQAENVYKLALPMYGQEQAMKLADAANQNPEAGQKLLEQLGGSVEKMREEGATTTREDSLAKQETMDRYAAYRSYGIPDDISKTMSENEGTSMEQGVKLYFDKLVADGEIADSKYLTQRATSDSLSNVNNQIRQINKTMGLVDGTTTGLIGAMIGGIPGTTAYELSGSLDTQRAATAFKALKEMRESSKTGGALGNVSNREIELLYKSFAALDEKFGEDLTFENLADVLMDFQRVEYMLENEVRFAEEGVSGSEMYRLSSEAVNERMAREQSTPDKDVVGALNSLRENPTPSRISAFKDTFGYQPLNLKIR